jgi:hypothetical protein
MTGQRTNILVIGTLASGSSALVDMLREYDNVNVLPREFDTFRRPGYVYDQLSYQTSIDYPNVIDKEIKFYSKKWELFYKSSLWKTFFKGEHHLISEKDWGRFQKYQDSIRTLKHISLLQDLSQILKSQVSYDDKIAASNEWITQIGNTYSTRFDYTVYNQPLLPWFDQAIWTKVFKPFKLICVLREPRDQVAEMIRREIEFSPFRTSQLSYGQFNIVSIYGNDRKGRFNFITEALRKRFEKIDQWLKVLDQGEVLLVDFEGLVKNHDLYKLEIEKFLGIDGLNHIDKRKHFNPDIALRNSIGIFNDYLDDSEQNALADLEEWHGQKIKTWTGILDQNRIKI